VNATLTIANDPNAPDLTDTPPALDGDGKSLSIDTAPCDCDAPRFLTLLTTLPTGKSVQEVAEWTRRTLANANLRELGVDKAALLGFCQTGSTGCTANAVVALSTVDKLIDAKIHPAPVPAPTAAGQNDKGQRPESPAADVSHSHGVIVQPEYGGRFVNYVVGWRGPYDQLADAIRRQLATADRPALEIVDAALQGACFERAKCPNSVAVAQVEVKHLIDGLDVQRQSTEQNIGYLIVLVAALLGVFGSLVSVIVAGRESRKTSEALTDILAEIGRNVSRNRPRIHKSHPKIKARRRISGP
jgi:hypothetical protein